MNAFKIRRLTPARQPIQQDMIEFLKTLKQQYAIGAVGGSDLNKIKEQLQDSMSLFNYVFTENGLVGFKDNQKFHEKVKIY
jgi:phosphomannomutase